MSRYACLPSDPCLRTREVMVRTRYACHGSAWCHVSHSPQKPGRGATFQVIGVGDHQQHRHHWPFNQSDVQQGCTWGGQWWFWWWNSSEHGTKEPSKNCYCQEHKNFSKGLYGCIHRNIQICHRYKSKKWWKCEHFGPFWNWDQWNPNSVSKVTSKFVCCQSRHHFCVCSRWCYWGKFGSLTFYIIYRL